MLSSRNVRSMAGLSAGAVMVGGVLLGLWAVQGAQGAQAALGTDPGGVALSPASGAVSGTPTWSTNTACPSGFRGSAVFRAVKPDGTTFSISAATNEVTAPFHGTLQGPISEIKSVAGVANGGSQEFVVVCFSGDSLTGTSHPDMDTFITYSANGTSYTTSSVAPTSTAGAPSSSSSGTGSGSHPSSSSADSSTSTSGSSSSDTTPSPSTTVVTSSPSATGSPAASPSPVNSNLAVTG
jgi:hypothetical protein